MRDLLQQHVDAGSVPGAVALVAHGDRIEVAAAGLADIEGAVPMARDTIVRLASITKPITAAAVMLLVEEGRVGLEDPVATWLPELAEPVVVRTPSSPVDDVVPLARPITVGDLLTSTTGWGFPSDFALPAVGSLLAVQTDGRELQLRPDHAEWLTRLAGVPMLYQPGEAWLYDTSSDLQGILIARVSGQSLPEFLAERIFAPLGMSDTGFDVPAAKLDRFAGYYRRAPGGFELDDPPAGRWSRLPVFHAGAGGLVGTIDDWHRFARMLLDEGAIGDGRLLTPASVRGMTTNHLDPAQREPGQLFLEGQGWGYGGSVDTDEIEPWNEPGRYGWVGGTGTSAYIVPPRDTAAILLTQVAAMGPVAPAVMRDFWAYVAAGFGSPR